MCTNFQTKRTFLNFWAQIAQKWIWGSESQKSKSGFEINTSKIPYEPIFSQNGQLLVFQPKFGEIAQLRAIFWFRFVESVAESWVEAEMSWVEVEMSWLEVDGAGWSWVEVGARFSTTHKKI